MYKSHFFIYWLEVQFKVIKLNKIFLYRRHISLYTIEFAVIFDAMSLVRSNDRLWGINFNTSVSISYGIQTHMNKNWLLLCGNINHQKYGINGSFPTTEVKGYIFWFVWMNYLFTLIWSDMYFQAFHNHSITKFWENCIKYFCVFNSIIIFYWESVF